VLKRQKKLAEAVALEQRILPMAEKAFGPEHPKVAMVLVNLGYHEEALDKPKDALDHHTRALAIFEKKFGKDGAYNSYALLGMGQDLIDLQRPADALPLYERAVEIRTKAGMPPAALKEATDSVAFAKKKLHR
jgi:eukaryotic-like serine/threonine-protein kinase